MSWVQMLEFNPNHDDHGEFSTGGGSGYSHSISKFEKADYGGTRANFELSVGDKSVGDVEIIKLGATTAQMENLNVIQSERGKGHAKEMYRRAFTELKGQGFLHVESSKLQQPGGTAVWKSLQKELPITFSHEQFHLDLRKI